MTLAEGALLDLRGLKCPLPVLRARKSLGQLAQGQKVTILTTDPLAVIDIPHMCFEDGHVCASPYQNDGAHHFQITVGSNQD